jgi:hypothetical protein
VLSAVERDGTRGVISYQVVVCLHHDYIPYLLMRHATPKYSMSIPLLKLNVER